MKPVLICFFTGLLLITGANTVSQAAEWPNILLIVADDQSPFDLNIYNPKSPLQTPTLSRLAEQGTVIEAAHHMGAWSGAVCTASRHMIMTGRSVWHVPCQPGRTSNPHTNNPKLVPPDLANFSLPAIFNRAGYETMRTCKTGNSYQAANDRFQIVHDRKRRDANGSDWHADRVLDYLRDRQARETESPFLIYLGFSHPHDERNGKPELLAKYGAVNHRDPDSLPAANPQQPPLPVNYLPAHPFDNGAMAIRDEVRVSGVWKNRDEQTIRNELGRQLACSENIDLQIARVLDQLEQFGQLANTYIIYTSDHGIAIGRHGLQGKQNLYEHTFRVPLIVAGPGVKPRHRPVGNVYLSDLLATLCDLTGVDPPHSNEGLSFATVLRGQQNSVRDSLYGVYRDHTAGIRCLKRGRWKLISYHHRKTDRRRFQLFDLQQNPHELLAEHAATDVCRLTGCTPAPHQVNLASDPQYAGIRQQLEAELLRHQELLDDPDLR